MRNNKLRTHWDRLSGEEVRALQAEQLRTFLKKHVLPFSAHYKKVFADNKISADDFNSLDDLKRIPFASKLDLLPTDENPNKARDFILIPDEKVLSKRPEVILRALLRGREAAKKSLAHEYRPIFLTSTTGRSTESVSFLYSQYDIRNLQDAGDRLVRVIDAHADQRLLNMFPYAPHLAFWLCHYATSAFGVFCVSTGGGKVMGTEGNIRMILKTKAHAILGMPTFLYHVLNQAAEEGHRFENLHHLVLGGEKVPQGMRRKLAELVRQLGGSDNAAVTATYGFTEAKTAWGECPFPLDQESGGYHTYPDLGIVEVIDSETGEPVGEGEPGEIVFTPIDARGSVVLRYRTGDFIDGGLVYSPCPHCGRTMPRLVGNISRQSAVKELQLGKIKGTLVDFNELERVLDDQDNVGAWQLELRKINDDPHELDEVILHVQKVGSVDDATLKKRVSERLVSCTEVRPNDIVFHNASDMRERQGVGVEMKEKRLVDNRPQDGQPAPPRESSQREGILATMFKRRKGGQDE